MLLGLRNACDSQTPHKVFRQEPEEAAEEKETVAEAEAEDSCCPE